MATAASVTTDLTTCPICLELFDNPKSLPCLHAFCLKCLQGNFKDKRPGDEVSCPVCRKEFHIPSNGLDGLPHQFFIQQMVDARQAELCKESEKVSCEESDEVLCEVCLEERVDDSDKISPATVYCFDCNQKLCEQCSKPHRRWKGGAHQVKPLGTEVEQELMQLRGSACDKHKDKQVELYCHDCKENVCVVCYAVKHRNHNSGEIPEVADSFRHRIDEDGQQILSAINAVRELSGQTQQNTTEFLNKAEYVKKKVLAVGDVVKRSVDDQVNDVLMELQSVTSESAKEAESVQESYQLALASMESFHTYSRELLDKGRPSDITRAAGELHDRATELLNNDVTAVKFCPPHVTFRPADVTQVKRLNLIGQLTVRTEGQPEQERDGEQVKQASDRAAVLQDELIQAADRERQLQMQLDRMKDDLGQLQRWFEQRPSLQKEFDDFKRRTAPQLEHEMKQRDSDMGGVIRTLPERKPVRGVTSLDNELYVLRGNKSSEQIEVYDIDSYCLLRCLTVPGLGDGYGIVACGHNRCAYISDWSHTSIHRVALSDATVVTQWPVNDTPACLSLTYTHGVLVSCWRVRKIKEFSTDGQLLHVLTLPQDVAIPLHAIQLSSGQFIVCHGDSDDPLNCVCLIDSDGSVVKSYGGPPGPGSQRKNLPAHMAVDRNGFVFVVDFNNRRVLLLSPQLTYVRDVVSRGQLKSRPLRVHLDSDRGRLYVADNDDWGAGRVVVVRV